MHLRELNYPSKYWFNLHNHVELEPRSEPLIKCRRPTQNRLNRCLLHLYPFIQRILYCGAIDRKKGHIRCAKTPINPEQFNLIEKLGGGSRYSQLEYLENILQLEYGFSYKGYRRSIVNLQFRLQKQRPVIVGKHPVLLLRFRFQQKQPQLIE